ncbi:MAG: adenylate kinase [Candidatus Delongbacteria bacterium]|nr:adenylate kinase [Candidatus Delongbacteria bacterium]MCG2760453.1 adenylate kinase [Candidatus Delongbacteria bacterium]
MNILLLGAPGSGKGSQAELLLNDYNLIQISTGDLLRQAVSKKTEQGILASGYMNKGELVPDELVLNILSLRLQKPDCKKGVIFDGYPRNVKQAEMLEDILQKEGKKLDIVFNIDLPFDIVLKRLLSRRICSTCGKGYNMISNPPKGNTCEDCGSKIITRDDDKESVIINRLEVYVENTKPLIEHYRNKGILTDIDGNRAVPEIYGELKEILTQKLGLKNQ